MNFLGKVGRLVRHEECQFETCGHEFKEPISRAVCFFPASFSCSGIGLEMLKKVGFSEVWDSARFIRWKRGASLLSGLDRKQ